MTIEERAYDEQKLVESLEQAGFGGSVTRSGAAKAEPDKATAGIPADEAAVEQYSPPYFGEHVRVSAHLDRDTLHPGDSFRLAVVFDIQEDWHIYGNPLGPGIGQKTVVSAQAPEGFYFEPARYALAHKMKQDFGDAGSTVVVQRFLRPELFKATRGLI